MWLPLGVPLPFPSVIEVVLLLIFCPSPSVHQLLLVPGSSLAHAHTHTYTHIHTTCVSKTRQSRDHPPSISTKCQQLTSSNECPPVMKYEEGKVGEGRRTGEGRDEGYEIQHSGRHGNEEDDRLWYLTGTLFPGRSPSSVTSPPLPSRLCPTCPPQSLVLVLKQRCRGGRGWLS